MKVPMSNLSAEYEANKDAIDAAFQRVIKSGNFTLGEEVDLFEQELADYCGSKLYDWCWVGYRSN